jgi:hypothetical protein
MSIRFGSLVSGSCSARWRSASADSVASARACALKMYAVATSARICPLTTSSAVSACGARE